MGFFASDSEFLLLSLYDQTYIDLCLRPQYLPLFSSEEVKVWGILYMGALFWVGERIKIHCDLSFQPIWMILVPKYSS